MSERTAAFVERMWTGDGGVAGAMVSALLTPAELAFRGASSLRNRAFSRGLRSVVHAPIPVISVGNIAVGGAGKTPFSAFLAHRLLAFGHRPALLHGGYAEDEPMLHRRWNPDVPVYVGRDRAASAHAAAAAGATVAILDDGFQHRRLARDVDFVLVAAETWTDSPRLLPRGPWREPPSSLRRASAVVVTHRTDVDASRVRAEVQHVAPGVPVWIARMTPVRWRRPASPAQDHDRVRDADDAGSDVQSAGPPQRPALLVAAVAHPELFIAGARTAGARIDDVLTYRDHHAYTNADATQIAARAAGRPIVTTAKDWVKLAGLLPPDVVWLLEQDVVMTDGAEALDGLLSSLPVRDA